jgi:hypothetical protein
MKPSTEFRFGELWFDQGIKHPKLLGAFNRSGALCSVRLADDANGNNVEWKRHALETPGEFQDRCCADILELMGLAQRPSIDSQQATQAAE